MRRLLWTAIGVAAAITTALVLFPTLDVAISSLAYGPDGFVLPRAGLVSAMSWLVTILSWVALTGAHFVSDVASSALLTLLAIVLLDRLLVRHPRAAPG